MGRIVRCQLVPQVNSLRAGSDCLVWAPGLTKAVGERSESRGQVGHEAWIVGDQLTAYVDGLEHGSDPCVGAADLPVQISEVVQCLGQVGPAGGVLAG